MRSPWRRQADHAQIEVGTDGLKALLAYPGPNVNPNALRQRSGTEASPIRPDASQAQLLSTSLDHAALNQPEAATWQS
jgi:mannose-6-phosphate isomerase